MLKEDKLNYGYSELEPYIDTHTLGLHYNKHYLNYLNNLNKILNKYQIQYVAKNNLDGVLSAINKMEQNDTYDALFNLGGVINHEIYFDSISPNKNNKLVGKIKDDIEKKYGNHNNFKKEILNCVKTLQGSGYTYLVKDRNNELQILNFPNQAIPEFYGYKPIMNIDLWEHAYYINYKNNKEEYINNFFDILDWNKINKRYESI
ncbi:MAG: superoxide dismutase [Bacilli bacterium]|nr:superoxide dismutase [Bacilli bacterium]